ncbi:MULTISPECIES: DUF1996 domain-containing protein [unclassified Streptomyces]|uniref:DUF1996 domain-containing protein n=1 Tax=unclassified Streptomyces TaxID=2593676 RepID=UPI000747F7BD|nr:MULTISPECIES: DUF1996 domain-containing protein [unclassified Streptomyces]KUL69120.1 hypothetical protein ADL34_32030 [Streptomyces sp. NRRL WC-3605]KUL80155.1 hypothetical protein ADL33_02710 [Streptomyces sp. NRRL WC-3604]
MLGGGGLVAANVYASATEEGGTDPAQTLSTPAGTIDCPDVGTKLTNVPEGAKEDVAKELALLDQQIADAYQRLMNAGQAIEQDAAFADNSIMNPLKEKRAATIERIAIAVDRQGDRPEGLDALAACTLRAPESSAPAGEESDGAQNTGDAGQGGQQGGDDQNAGNGQNGQNGNGGQAGNGPVAEDYVDIKSVQPNVSEPAVRKGGSRGTFATSCGVNENGLFNSDNVIVAPGVSNGAHHFHDYIGNQSNTAFASDEDLANAETSCVDQSDKSTYYWPVLRLQNGKQEQDADKPGGGIEGNAGEIVRAKEVTLNFVGNPQSKVTEMPRLLRIITGDAKAFVNGPANANASWSCTGFEDRQLKDKYPLCPKGSDVVRTFKFQSCWDGQNIDSANHRAHVAFAAADGSCGNGFKAIPQLVQRIVYDVDAPSLQDGGKTTPLFAVDSFPEQLHKPITDHGDFINVFDEKLMSEMVDCINAGRTCGVGAGDGGDGGDGGQEEPTQAPTTPPADNDGGNGGNDGGNGDDQTEPPATQDPTTEAPQTDQPGDGKDDGGKGDDGQGDGGNGGAGNGDDGNAGTGQDDEPTGATTVAPKVSGQPDAGNDAGDDQAEVIGTPAQTQPPTSDTDSLTGGARAQAVGGDLAETGTSLWPAAGGAILLIAGFVVLMRTRRHAR